MRDIKFRGRIAQGLENAGHWVYWGLNGTDMLDALDPDTIGEYIGRKDKNGKEIYEGDITTNGIVRWFNELSWDSGGSNHPGFYFAEYDDGDLDYHCGFDDECEIIGNIYENPELLK